MYLAIDMSQMRTIHLVLFDAKTHVEMQIEGKNADVLATIADFLKAQNRAPETLRGIAVVMGEGTFTSTRLAATVANTFQYVHQIPLLEIRSTDISDTSKLVKEFETNGVHHFLSATYSGAPRINMK